MYNMPYSQPYHGSYIHQNSQLQGFSPYHTSHHHAPIHSQPSGYNQSYYAQHQYNPGYGEMPARRPTTRTEGRSRSFDNEARRSQVAPVSTREQENRRVSSTYDVSSTIVDGSSRMKQSRAGVKFH